MSSLLSLSLQKQSSSARLLAEAGPFPPPTRPLRTAALWFVLPPKPAPIIIGGRFGSAGLSAPRPEKGPASAKLRRAEPAKLPRPQTPAIAERADLKLAADRLTRPQTRHTQPAQSWLSPAEASMALAGETGNGSILLPMGGCALIRVYRAKTPGDYDQNGLGKNRHATHSPTAFCAFAHKRQAGTEARKPAFPPHPPAQLRRPSPLRFSNWRGLALLAVCHCSRHPAASRPGQGSALRRGGGMPDR